MGNCIGCESTVSWADDDEEWGRPEHGSHRREAPLGEEEEGELMKRSSDVVSADGASTEVRIKISKKKLEELLRYSDAQGLPLHQLLARLLSGADHAAGAGRRCWQPSLESITELDERW